jgi:hypothetical protein
VIRFAVATVHTIPKKRRCGLTRILKPPLKSTSLSLGTRDNRADSMTNAR